MRAMAGVGRPGVTGGGAARRAGAAAGGFSLGAARSAAAGAAMPLASAGAESLLALQATAPQSSGPATIAHADVMMCGLDALQRAMVSADPAQREEALAQLAGNLESLPRAAADPGLAEILDALALRAAVELARQSVAVPARKG